MAFGVIAMLLSFSSCGDRRKVFGDAITERDSMPVMSTLGMSTLVSDSGVIRYRVNAEEWLMYDRKKPSYWAFEKGAHLEQFDSLMNIDASIKSDTAYYYDKEKLWKLIGHVDIKNLKGDHLTTELLYWNQNTQRIYSDKFVRIEQAGGELLTGYGFESDQQLNSPKIFNVAGEFYIDEESDASGSTVQADTVK